MLKKIKEFIKEFYSKDEKKLKEEEIEFLPAALEVIEMPPSPVGRTVLWTLFALIIVTFVWVMVGSVDEVAVANGKIIPNGQVKTIQAEDKGVVKEIHVVEGQIVKKGDLLIELDTTITEADVNNLRHQVAYYSLDIERLLAEQANASFIVKEHLGLEPRDILFQQNLYNSRLAEYNAKMAVAQSNMRQAEASLASARSGYVKLIDMYNIAKEKEERVEKLATENAISTFILLDHQSKRVELGEDINAQQSEIAKLEWGLVQAQQQLDSINAERNRDITSALVEDKKQLASYQEELKKAEEKNRLSRIVAPIDGRVSQLSVHTIGGVVTAAQGLMEIVPEDAVLQVEAWVQNKDIGFVQVGQPAEVKVETFSFQKFGTIDAKITEISPNAVEDKEKGRVYRVMLELDKNSFVVNGQEVPLGSGMTSTAEIKIRQKRIIEFFLDPFRQYKSEALRER
ncbi:HlyD family type I secretion periplasmic adaptor subunit [Anaerosinus sp.]